MKKKILNALLIAVLLSLVAVPVLAQGEEPPVPPLQLPDALTSLVGIFMVWLVTLGLKSLSNLLHADLTGSAAAIAASLSAAVIFFLQGLVNALPDPWNNIVLAGFSFLIVILGSFGLYRFSKSFVPNPTALEGKKSSNL